MRIQLTILAALIPIAAAAQAGSGEAFRFWFQRDAACVACAQMPPPGTSEKFLEEAGIDVMFNGYDQATGKHWLNQKVESYVVTYTYELDGATHSVKLFAAGDAASVVFKPYAPADINKARVVSIAVTATYSSGPVTKQVSSPAAFKVY
jgi:hypothetical protein